MLDTQTQPEFEEPNKKYTGTGMEDDVSCYIEVVYPKRGRREDSLILDDIMIKELQGGFFPVVYIRPKATMLMDLNSTVKEILFYSNAEFKNEYKVRGPDSKEVKDRILEELTQRNPELKYEEKEIKKDVFQINYFKGYSPDDLESVKLLMKVLETEKSSDNPNSLESVVREVHEEL